MIARTIAEQREWGVLYSQSMNAIYFLSANWSENGQFNPPNEELITETLLRRVRRVSGPEDLCAQSLKRLLEAEVRLSKGRSLEQFRWLTRELERCLVRYPKGLSKYLRQQRDHLSEETIAALCILGISSASDEGDRRLLLAYLAEMNGMGLPIAIATEPQESALTFTTAAQSRALERVIAMGDAFYSGHSSSALKARLFPLLCGPTGTGKTHLTRLAAKTLGAQLVFATPGDWIPQGSGADFLPTTYSILTALASSHRVVLVLDELDKARPDWDSTWSRSIASEIWHVLDGHLPVTAFAKSSRANLVENAITEEKLAAKSRDLFIIGSGTWQSHYDSRRPMGFASGATPSPLSVSQVRSFGGIPPELLLRFNPSLIEVPYPSPSETQVIFEQSGISDAATRLGLKLDPWSHDWSAGGVRTLEALWAEITILERRSKHHDRTH